MARGRPGRGPAVAVRDGGGPVTRGAVARPTGPAPASVSGHGARLAGLGRSGGPRCRGVRAGWGAATCVRRAGARFAAGGRVRRCRTRRWRRRTRAAGWRRGAGWSTNHPCHHGRWRDGALRGAGPDPAARSPRRRVGDSPPRCPPTYRSVLSAAGRPVVPAVVPRSAERLRPDHPAPRRRPPRRPAAPVAPGEGRRWRGGRRRRRRELPDRGRRVAPQARTRPRTGPAQTPAQAPVQTRGRVTGISLSECRVSGY